MDGVFNIEILECGVWDVLDTASSLMDALYIASGYTETVSEDRLRICTPDNQFI